MNFKVMQGLIGAHTSMKLAETPMSVYRKEAAKDEPDEEVMERALGYAEKQSNYADGYIKNAGEGAAEEASSVREEKISESKVALRSYSSDNNKTAAEAINDIVDISETGQKLSDSNSTAKAVPVLLSGIIYNSTGDAVNMQGASKFNAVI